MNSDREQLSVFKIQPLKAAKVSEISETTAGSPVPPEDRVNFHIGHPVWDPGLVARYRQLAFDLPEPPLSGNPREFRTLLEESAWDEDQYEAVEFLCETIDKSVQYMPRGGFSAKAPNRLATLALEWFTEIQQEPLEYDLGETSGRRELIFSSGGILEGLRVFLHAIAHHLARLPAEVLLFRTDLPDHLTRYDSLDFTPLPADETRALEAIHARLSRSPETPHFLILGAVPSERTRRSLRRISLEQPLFFVEVNGASNDLSLAREAGLLNRVLRLITPGSIDPALSESAVTFVAGNADFIALFETIHFQLKGAPSAAEVELLAYLLDKKFHQEEPTTLFTPPEIPPRPSLDTDHQLDADPPGNDPGSRVAARLEHLVRERTESMAALTDRLFYTGERSRQRLAEIGPGESRLADPFAGHLRSEVVQEFFQQIDSPGWQRELEQAFLSAFVSHHPEYDPDACTVVSGSARTALSLLGFQCGIDEVVVPDLSWTYHHCFPNITPVPLGEHLALDADAVIDTVRQKLEADPDWGAHGAVAINNPHNASGEVFDEAEVTRLLTWLLQHEVFVIDDLAYQDVAPAGRLTGPKSLRQITQELLDGGYLRRSQAQYLMTVHALSKTDCFAGARLGVAEILHPALRATFRHLNSLIQPNSTALLLAYLFYRNGPQQVRSFWTARNQVFNRRMEALEYALSHLPDERNPYHIDIRRPRGAMYPRLVIRDLPAGISLDWLATGLAARGIGLVPLTTFARTARGYELGRKSFRLTLGGGDPAEILTRKTRRVLIELNRIIADEAANYTRKSLPVRPQPHDRTGARYLESVPRHWESILQGLSRLSNKQFHRQSRKIIANGGAVSDQEFIEEYLPDRLDTFTRRFRDRLYIAETIISQNRSNQKERVLQILDQEFYKESLADRTEQFRHRLFDRTVHPTQMYSLEVDVAVNQIIDLLIHKQTVPSGQIEDLSGQLVREYFGINVPILSVEETDELGTDLGAMIETEEWTLFKSGMHAPRLLSFWGDWDGSTRPSGQGHRLVAAALTRNVTHMAHLLEMVMKYDSSVDVDSELLDQIRRLDGDKQKFWNLLNKITSLTNQLEKRYQQVLPYNYRPGRLRRLGMRLHLARDPMTALWQHNDRLERRMVKLRSQRREGLEYYFALNKRLRKTLYANQDAILRNLDHPDLALRAGLYRSFLKRFVLTPRIHQKMILAQDQFGIDTTVYNIMEINELAGKYGNPGMVLGLQVSMSDDPEAFIALDRKLRARREDLLRKEEGLTLPPVYIIPLFEEVEVVRHLEDYLDKVWEYAVHSRRLEQQPADRFCEMVCELFVAGSDLSQQVSQPTGAALYREAKHRSIRWLAKRGLVENVRIKFGSGEPMQRQGGYYDLHSGEAAIGSSPQVEKRLERFLDSASRKSTQFARSPLRGVWASGEFRTFQSNIFEHLRRLTAGQRADLFYHINASQHAYETELARAAEPLLSTRLRFEKRGLQELEMLTLGRQDETYEEFLDLVTKNYRQILYGREEDVVGLHVISYFIARTTPALRDRPVVRPSSGSGEKRGQQIVERIAQTLPLSRHGSLLRAIGHNRAQTMIMGVNQLTTGLFRALGEFSEAHASGNEAVAAISDRILPHLPVHDILHTLRLYHDTTLHYIQRLEQIFPAGNSAFYGLREDTDSIAGYLSLFQKELLRRQGLQPTDFFNGNHINPQLLPALRPDIAVLMQPDLFNTDREQFDVQIGDTPDEAWRKEAYQLLQLPLTIRAWREKIWRLIEAPIRQQVESFVKLAMAIHTLSSGAGGDQLPFSTDPARAVRLGTQVTESLRGVGDDSMRQFLSAVVQYLTQIPETMSEVPIDVIRALRDVERIVKIEEQALGEKDQVLFRFYLLQIARLAGENG